MKKATFTFGFSLSELIQRNDKVLQFIARDAADFTRFGYGEPWRTGIEQTAGALRLILPDDYYGAQQKHKTQLKNDCRKHLERFIGDLRIRAKYSLGEKSYDYQMYNFTKIGTLNDKELITFTLHIIKIAQNQLAHLALRNADQTLIDNIETSRQELDDAIDDQQMAVSERREMRFKRTQLANQLYQFISEACDIGKNIWNGTNDAYYTDYVIYGSKQTIDEVEELEEMEATTGEETGN
ncbi:MAG: hypothetical protein JEZ14_26185 [Marinilabiliaceae bacterium]|nr:hypothetical protein [Marinilabiliaceae bacterium]